MVRLATVSLITLIALLGVTYQQTFDSTGSEGPDQPSLDEEIGTGSQSTAAAPDQCRGQWLDPVEAEVIDPFRPPADQFSAGNRGLEFGTQGGEVVLASQVGNVSFAGPVGGRLFVVVVHPNGYRSTYGYLEDTAVAAGAAVDQGATIGRASVGFHFTVRDDGRYLDPAPLLASVQCHRRVKLVPLSAVEG